MMTFCCSLLQLRVLEGCRGRAAVLYSKCCRRVLVEEAAETKKKHQATTDAIREDTRASNCTALFSIATLALLSHTQADSRDMDNFKIVLEGKIVSVPTSYQTPAT